MSRVYPAGGGAPGINPNAITALPGDVLAGVTAGVKGSYEPVAGTLTLTGNAQTNQVLKNATFYNTNAKSKLTGTVDIQSILSFSSAPYSASQMVFTWKNPAMGPFSGVIIVGKTGSYPTSITDGTRYYKGWGNNSAANGTSNTVVSGFSTGVTYYFRAFSYAIKDGAEWVSATTYTANAIINKIIQTFTSSQTWTVPTGVTAIDIFIVGGGAGGGLGSNGTNGTNCGGGGGSGYTTTVLNRSVTPGSQLSIIVGSGGGAQTNGNASSVAGIASAEGGKFGKPGYDSIIGNNGSGGAGGSGGGGGSWFSKNVGNYPGGNGGSDGTNGESPGGAGNGGVGQKTTTRAFAEASGTLYAGAGGGGGNAQYSNTWRGLGGAGGGGNGSDAMGNEGSSGTPGTGGGGGGGYGYTGSSGGFGYPGGSGVVLIRWYG